MPRPWAFPAPERGTLGNGLTVLTCHRPGQQVVAVGICSTPRSVPNPTRLEGVAAILPDAFNEGTDNHTAEEFAAELERCGATSDARADHPACNVARRFPLPPGARPHPGLAEALRAPALPENEIERLVANRLDEIVHELANPGRRAAFALHAALSRRGRPALAAQGGLRGHRPRIDRSGVHAFYTAHVRPATATVVIVGDLDGTDLRCRPRPGPSACGPATRRSPACHAPVTADDKARVVVVDRPGSVQTQLLIGRHRPDRHNETWPARSSAPIASVAPYFPAGPGPPRGEGLHLRSAGPRARCRCACRCQRLRAGRCSPSRARWTPPQPHPHSPMPWAVLRTLAAEGLTVAERDVAVQNLVGVAPLKYETASAVAGTLADQVEQGLPDDYQAQIYRRLTEVDAEAATAAVVAAFPAGAPGHGPGGRRVRHRGPGQGTRHR